MDRLNLAKNLAVLVKGFIAMVMQIIIIRELLIIFSGNELSLGIVLFNWLLLEALGSGLLAKLFTKLKNETNAYIILQILITLSLPLTVWLTRTAKANLGIFHGEIVNLPQMFLISFSSLLIFSLLDGLQFFFACRMLSGDKTAGLAITKAYILEALGMLLGGVVFTYVFLKLLNSFQITFLLGALAIISMYFLLIVSQSSRKKTLSVLLIFLFILNIWFMASGEFDLLHNLSLKKQFPEEKILDYKNSIYGNISVTQKQNQITFYANGIPTIVTPITDIGFAEEFIHLSLLYHPLPKDILIISGAAGGILNEILKEPISQIDYAELDPLIIREIKKFPSSITVKELSAPAVNIIYQDGRSLVNKSEKKYDAIIINLPSPTTLQINRLFTREFYQKAKNILKPGGIISARAPGSLTYLNDELCQLNNSIYTTLSAIYKNVFVIPGDFNLFLASDALDFRKVDIKTIVSRFRSRNLKTNFLTEFSLNYRLDKTWRDWFFERLKGVEKTKFLNEDFSPRGLFFSLAFLYSLIAPKTKILFSAMDKIKLPVIIWAIFLLLLISLLFLKLNRKNKAVAMSLNWLILTSGFCAITLELILILGFQIICGLIYSWIGILSSAFMLGLACGGYIISAKSEKIKDDTKFILELEFFIISFIAVLPLLLILLSKISGEIAFLIKPLFFFLSFLSGFILGAEFAQTNKLYLKNLKGGEKSCPQLYAFDLIGASLGAILTAVWLIPVLGVWETGLLLASLKLGAVIALIFSVKKQIA